MKLLALALVLISFQAFAQDVTMLDQGDIHLSDTTSKILSVSKICPRVPGRMTCMAYGSKAKVEVTLNGCLDRLGGYFSKFEVIDGRGILYFGAVNIFNKASMTARCTKIPTQTVTINLPFEGEVELVPTQFTGMN